MHSSMAIEWQCIICKWVWHLLNKREIVSFDRSEFLASYSVICRTSVAWIFAPPPPPSPSSMLRFRDMLNAEKEFRLSYNTLSHCKVLWLLVALPAWVWAFRFLPLLCRTGVACFLHLLELWFRVLLTVQFLLQCGTRYMENHHKAWRLIIIPLNRSDLLWFSLSNAGLWWFALSPTFFGVVIQGAVECGSHISVCQVISELVVCRAVVKKERFGCFIKIAKRLLLLILNSTSLADHMWKLRRLGILLFPLSCLLSCCVYGKILLIKSCQVGCLLWHLPWEEFPLSYSV